MQNIKLPEQVSRTYFNCFEQQIMTLCYYYHEEFWKLFLGQNIVYQRGKDNIEDILKYKNLLVENAKKYYGIQFKDKGKINKLKFENGEIYLAYLDTRFYPFTKDMEEIGIHCVLIYGSVKEGYVVNDNYYGVTDYILDEKLYNQGIKKIHIVEYIEEKNLIDTSFEDFITNFSYSSYKVMLEGVNYIIKNKIVSYQSAKLLDLIHDIYCFAKKDAIMAGIWSEKNEYLEKSVQIILSLADKMRKTFYAILKEQLRYEVIPEHLLYQKFDKIVKIFKCEERVKREIVNILLHKECIIDKLHLQVLSYLKLEKFDYSTSVYDIHDRLSIIYLINYFENCNDLKELEYEEFVNCDSYIEFVLVIYEKIICKELY